MAMAMVNRMVMVMVNRMVMVMVKVMVILMVMVEHAMHFDIQAMTMDAFRVVATLLAYAWVLKGDFD